MFRKSQTIIYVGDCREVLKTLPNESIHCVITSPPYFNLRDYGTAEWEGGDSRCNHILLDDRIVKQTSNRGTKQKIFKSECGKCGAHRIDNQIGLESDYKTYVDEMVAVFREIRRVLRTDGTVWLNLGDSYAGGNNGGNRGKDGTKQKTNHGSLIKTSGLANGLKPKDLVGIPWRVAFALQNDGWCLRQDIIWSKPNCMPESVTDRCTKSHEYIFLLTKSQKYFFDADAIQEIDRIPGNVNPYGRGTDDPLLSNSGKGIFAAQQRAQMTQNKRSVWTIPTAATGSVVIVRQVHVEYDAPVDGKVRKVSPDCPLHGDCVDLVSKASYDEHEGFSRNHNSGTDNYHVQEQKSYSVPTDRHRGQTTSERNSDSHAPSHFSTANNHNNETRKTARAPATNPSYTSRVRSSSHNDDMSKSHEEPANSGGNNNVDPIPRNKTASHNARKSNERDFSSASRSSKKCTCEYYIEKTETTTHFATFPPDLIQPCILAGTSANGCCEKCGAPWVRETKKESIALRPNSDSIRGHSPSHFRAVGGNPQQGAPSCNCNAPQIPCTILDPFAGTGTVAMVANKCGRDAVLIELNPKSVEMARKRLGGGSLVSKPPKIIDFGKR